MQRLIENLLMLPYLLLVGNLQLFPSFSATSVSERPNYLISFPSSHSIISKFERRRNCCYVVEHNICPDPNVTFHLFTRKHPQVSEEIRISSNLHENNLRNTSFNSSNPVKIIIHGFNSDMNVEHLKEIKNQYLLSNDFNVVFIDWSPLGRKLICYLAALQNIEHVGSCSAQLVHALRNFGAEDFHVIGFSLGAHILHSLSKALQPYKVSRMTGIDPAGPGFCTIMKHSALNKEDAKFVDVIHSNSFLLGTPRQLGHVDFYLNGGVIQPGCLKERRDAGLKCVSCSHSRAVFYFAESINSKIGFWGSPCPSFVDYLGKGCPSMKPTMESTLMGEHVDKNSSGVHLVITNRVSPFAQGGHERSSNEILMNSEIYRKVVLINYKNAIVDYIRESSIYNDTYKESLKNRLEAQYLEDIASIF